MSTIIRYAFPMFLCNILCLMLDSTKPIRLLAFDFYEVIDDSGFALINYHLIEISISYNLIAFGLVFFI